MGRRVAQPPRGLGKHLRQEIARWSPVIRQAEAYLD